MPGLEPEQHGGVGVQRASMRDLAQQTLNGAFAAAGGHSCSLSWLLSRNIVLSGCIVTMHMWAGAPPSLRTETSV